MKRINNRTSLVAITIGTLLFVYVLYIPAIFQLARGQATVEAYPSDSKPYGLSYGEWTAKWWQWLAAVPSTVNPASDNTGVNCAQNQAGPVWFLSGSVTGKAERTCTVPAGKAILFTLINAECSYVEYPKLKTESDLRNCAVSQQNGVTHIETIVDGMSLQSPQMPRIQSPMFNLTFPVNNVFGNPVGQTQSVADGYYVFLKPLSTGKHDISFKAAEVQYTSTGVSNEAQNIVYHVTVR
jgi:hypothetical protein